MHFDLEDSRSLPEIVQMLRHLPTESAPPILWKEFKRRQVLRRVRARSAQRRQFALVAAVGLVMIGTIALWRHSPPMQGPMAQRSPVTTALPLTHRPVVPIAWDEAAVRSVASERWLAAQPAEPVIVRVGTRAAVTNLEDRIAWVDDTLTSMREKGGEADRTRALQFERDRLVNSLAQVRYAETLAANLP
jgi:hypothetical protein